MQVHRSARRGLTTAVALGALAVPATAGAHVTVQPQSGIEAGGFARIDVRVPNERDNASTEKVVVDVPPGFYSLNYEPVPGWTIKVNKEKLAAPVEQFGEQVTEQVKDVSFTADSEKDAIQPGQFQQFGLSGGPVPGKAGQSLSFPAIQTYSNGEVVRWIDKDPEAESPASTLKLLPAEGEGGTAPATPAKDDTASNAASKEDVDDKASKGLGVAALIVGALGLVVGIAAFAASRRKPAA
jgi:periplasmic copper chaperone A